MKIFWALLNGFGFAVMVITFASGDMATGSAWLVFFIFTLIGLVLEKK